MNFKWFFGFVIAFFVAMLILTFVVTKRANPVYLDQNGKPVKRSANITSPDDRRGRFSPAARSGYATHEL